MPIVPRRQVMKPGVAHRSNGETNFHGQKVPGFRFDGSGKSFQTASTDAIKNNGGSWFNIAHNTTSGVGQNAVEIAAEAIKLGGDWFGGYRKGQGPRNHGSKSNARKHASALIAKIPFPLAQYIARCFKP